MSSTRYSATACRHPRTGSAIIRQRWGPPVTQLVVTIPMKDAMIALGASARQISVTGAGSDFPPFVPDRSAAGTLRAGPATLNRSVRITLSSG